VGIALPPGSGPVAVAAIGEHTTSYVVVEDGVPRYVRIIPAEVLVGLHATMAARGEFGSTGLASTARRGVLEEEPVPDPSLAELVSRIRETLEFSRRSGGVSPRRLLITGSLGLVPEIQEALRKALDIEVDTLSPADVIAASAALAAEGLPASLMGALGVTLEVK
jgi:type IV pilus assembly protein PilM